MKKGTAKNAIKFNQKKFSSSYYDVIEVSYQKLTEKIIEHSNDMSIDDETIRKLSLLIETEKNNTKAWGLNILTKNIV